MNQTHTNIWCQVFVKNHFILKTAQGTLMRLLQTWLWIITEAEAHHVTAYGQSEERQCYSYMLLLDSLSGFQMSFGYTKLKTYRPHTVFYPSAPICSHDHVSSTCNYNISNSTHSQHWFPPFLMIFWFAGLHSDVLSPTTVAPVLLLKWIHVQVVRW